MVLDGIAGISGVSCELLLGKTAKIGQGKEGNELAKEDGRTFRMDAQDFVFIMVPALLQSWILLPVVHSRGQGINADVCVIQ